VTVTANKVGGGITMNYAGIAYAYPIALSNVGVTAGLANNIIAASSIVNGVGSANVTYEMATPQTAPFTLTLRATDSDMPAVSSSGHTEGITGIRSGRAKISNAHGSTLLNLLLPFRTEYWNNGWLLNTADTCSGDEVMGGIVSMTLSALPTTCVQDNGNPGLSEAGCVALGPVGQLFKEGGVGSFAGNFNLWLQAPGAGNTGAVTVTGDVPVWLRFPWGGGAAVNPVARATFGVYRGGAKFIYQRENYW
jgi:MSHA biogenesis protein MshQ